MRFTKMHGIGNDYVYVDGFDETVDDPASVAVAVSDRNFGIGSDGLILILPSDRADVRMRMFNADGSEGQMCGNGIRCVAKYAYDHGRCRANPMAIETLAGVKTVDLILGPDAGQGVPSNRFKAVDDKARQFTGTYSVTKGKVPADPNDSEFENYLINVIEDEVDGASNVSVDVTRVKITAKIKHGVFIKLNIKVKFNAQGEIDGVPAGGKGSLSQMGTGTPVGTIFAGSAPAPDAWSIYPIWPTS